MAVDLKAKRGDDWSIEGQVTDEETNLPVEDYFEDVTTAVIQVRATAESETVIVAFLSNAGEITFNGSFFTLTKANIDTVNLPPGKYVYDMQCTENGLTHTKVEGVFEITADVTRL